MIWKPSSIKAIKIKLEQTLLIKHFTVEHNGKTYYVEYANSDGYSAYLSNRFDWEILDEELEELCLCEFQDDTKEEKEQIKNNAKLMNKLIFFCIRHFLEYSKFSSFYWFGSAANKPS